MVTLSGLEDPEENSAVRRMIERHAQFTHSRLAATVLADWKVYAPKFVKVLPKDYARVLSALARIRESGLTGEEAVMAAFVENTRDVARIGGG
jgi:glutamate synthase (ferredoxin)